MWLNFFDWKLKTVYQLIGAVLSLVSDILQCEVVHVADAKID